MLGHPLDTRVRRTLAVSIDDGLELTFDDDASKYIPAGIAQPANSNSTFDGSPRTGRSSATLYWVGASVTLGAAHRVEDLDETVHELLAAPEPVTSGRQTLGYSAPILPITDLYPRSAELKANRKSDVIAEVVCALFNESEAKGQRGKYHDTLVELPAETWQYIDGLQNPQLCFADGSVWNLTEATLSREVPYVSASVKRAG